MRSPIERQRSVGFLEAESDSWACFLVTFPSTDRTWHGYFSFRHSDGADEIRTTDIFVEDSEAEIHLKAQGLGRPLLQGLLDSALHVQRKLNGAQTHLRARFRKLLTANSVELAGEWTVDEVQITNDEIDRLRSVYESYRIDQVSHLICLVESDDFDTAIDRILEAESVDFRSKDRVQFAMMVVDHIERLLPLPDFETWAEDFLSNPEAYRLYSHTLHREGRLP